ncbi:unnamed protein product, partial [Thlaspi arvense]
MGKKRTVKYFLVDAFTDSAFKGNPAAVCFLNDDDSDRDDAWLQSLAAEFNISQTCFLTPITGFEARFHLRWFTPLAEVDLCGHATLASAHCLFSNGLVDSEDVEFVTRSGILTAKRVPDTSELSDGEVKGGTFLIELNFPVVTTCDINLDDVSSSMITKALNGATIVDIKVTTTNNILAVLPSMESVNELQPRMDDILKCPCDGITVTAAGSAGSAYDFYSRFFAPKFGIDEDPVCGSAHCALAHYWSLKMNKCDFLAYQASPRSGTIGIHLDKEKQRVLLRGKAVTVMEGHVLTSKEEKEDDHDHGEASEGLRGNCIFFFNPKCDKLSRLMSVVDNQVDAFSESAFKGNPAVVCLLDGKNEKDDSWLQSHAAEFNSQFSGLMQISDGKSSIFISQVDLCAHVTLASAHTLFENGLFGSDTIKFATRSGTLTAKRVPETLTSSLTMKRKDLIGTKQSIRRLSITTEGRLYRSKHEPDCNSPQVWRGPEGELNRTRFCLQHVTGSFFIELDFPVIPTREYKTSTLNGAAIVDVRGTTTDKIISKAFALPKLLQLIKLSILLTIYAFCFHIVLPTWDSVTELHPRMDDLWKCPRKLIILAAAAPKGSAYDFCRLCLWKCTLLEPQDEQVRLCCLRGDYSLLLSSAILNLRSKANASRRSGTVKIHYDKEKQRVFLTGKAVTVMKGSVLV